MPPEPTVRPDWVVHRDAPVEEVAAVLSLEPTVVRADTPLDQVALAMLEHPNVHVACVVAQDSRLVGLLRLQDLADDLFFHIMPEEFLGEVTDLEHVMAYAERSRLKTAADAMQEPVWVRQGETVKEAFKRMHQHKLEGLPIVDDQYQVVGYINLLELLAVCLKCAAHPKAEDRSEGHP
ncbi:MAG: CBS domain-containing protein [Anaerolineae bacterium]|nr:CBS domain-containing protein [Anaerolineae bacterium]